MMHSPTQARVLSLQEAAQFAPAQVVALSEELAAAQHQIEWFKRQLFGQKSERRIAEAPSAQMSLGEVIDQGHAQDQAQERAVAGYTRRGVTKDKADATEEALPFFDETRVPVEVIELAAPETQGLRPEEFEVISYKDSYRLAQRPGSYVVLKYRRPVVKLHASQAIVCAKAPIGVIEGSRADVSFVAGLLIDKFAYHLPFYRQHQRLSDSGINVSRPWLTQIGQQGAGLLEPIYDAQFASIRASRVKAMDETPIKAGRAAPGKMKAAYFWPVYGELDEVCFPFFESRRHEHVEAALGLTHAEGAVLLSDGYSAYAQYAEKAKITHAQCWAHYLERGFIWRPMYLIAVRRRLEVLCAVHIISAHLVKHGIRSTVAGVFRSYGYSILHAAAVQGPASRQGHSARVARRSLRQREQCAAIPTMDRPVPTLLLRAWSWRSRRADARWSQALPGLVRAFPRDQPCPSRSCEFVDTLAAPRL